MLLYIAHVTFSNCLKGHQVLCSVKHRIFLPSSNLEILSLIKASRAQQLERMSRCFPASFFFKYFKNSQIQQSKQSVSTIDFPHLLYQPGQLLSTTQASSRLQACLHHPGRAPSGPDQPFHRIIIDRKSGPAERGTFPS